MYLYPVWVRLWHLLNAILIVILIVTGAVMQYAGSENPLLMAAFAGASRWHIIAAIILTISYLGFVIGNAVSGNCTYYRINEKNLFSDMGKQLKYFLWGIFRHEKQPFPVTVDNKFNPLQKVTYLLIMYFALPLLIISGLVLMIPDMTLIKLFGQGTYIVIDVLHIIQGLLISLFLIIHIYSCTIGPKPTSLFRGIITGFYGGDE